jgi:hypothetical protein
MYNLTRGNYGLINAYNPGTNLVTLTANAPANWANLDSLTIASQTVSGAGVNWLDLQLVSGPTTASVLFLTMRLSPDAVGKRFGCHPFSAFAGGKVSNVFGQVAGAVIEFFNVPMKLTSGCFSIFWDATPGYVMIKLGGYLP